jgi:4-hydroxy-tetrahydrodipicolinate synthase
MLTGTFTAIITPFNTSGDVDFEKLKELIEIQISAGIDGIVPMGTTGESPTLDFEEHEKVIQVAIETAKGRTKVIAGTGANSTAEAVRLTKNALENGADATLQVTPYYNKPTQEGLVRHFSTIADIGLPVVLYNVPGRSSREIAVETVVKLSEHGNVAAVKEAGGSVDRVSDILDRCDITVLSGDDSLTFPMMAIGAKGVISVASNLVPGPLTELTHLALEGKWDEARVLHFKYYRLFCDIFVDTNPIPVKSAMAMMGLVDEVYRLPLCAMTDDKKAILKNTLQTAGLL